LPIEPPIKNAFLLYDNEKPFAIFHSEVYVNFFVKSTKKYTKHAKCMIFLSIKSLYNTNDSNNVTITHGMRVNY